MQLNEETEFHLPKRRARERSIQYFIELRFGPKAIGAALAKIVADASAAVNGKVRATIDRDRLSYRLTAQGAREGVCPARIDHSAQAEHQIGYDRLFLEYRETNMNAAVNVGEWQRIVMGQCFSRPQSQRTLMGDPWKVTIFEVRQHPLVFQCVGDISSRHYVKPVKSITAADERTDFNAAGSHG